MKKSFYLLALVLVFSSLFLFDSIQTKMLVTWNWLAHQREIKLSGNQLLGKKRILESLDARHNNLVWRFNPNAVTNNLIRSSLIERVSMRPCAWYSLSCFQLELEERKPSILTKFRGELWLVSNDGSFMLTVPSDMAGQRAKAISKRLNVPIVLGLDKGVPASVVAQNRAKYVVRSIEIISKSNNREIANLEFMEDGELLVKFTNLPFRVRFSSSIVNEHLLTSELARLDQVVSQLAAYNSAIEQVDLAYNRLAVVKLTDRAMAAKAALKLAKK